MIIVPEGVLDDIVKPLWNESVTVKILVSDSENYFIDIMAASES